MTERLSEEALVALHAQWARLGAFLRVASTDAPVDLEALLIATASAAPDDARLLIIMGSWLQQYAPVVDTDRLQRMIVEHDRIARDGWPVTSATLGAALTWASDDNAPPLRQAAAACRPLDPPQWLSRVWAYVPALSALRRPDVMPAFAAWGLWHTDATFKTSIIRPRWWIEARCTELAARFARLPAAPVEPDEQRE